MENSIKGTQTEKNLMKAFADESQTALKYEWFAKAAKKEGYEQLSNMFLKTADQEKAHAKRLFRYLQGGEVEIVAGFSAAQIGISVDNLAASVEAEHKEWTKGYPRLADEARKEGFDEIAAVFRLIANAERTHERRFAKILKSLQDNTYFERVEETTWECLKCGYVHIGKEPPEICPACLHPKGYFEEEKLQG